MKRNYNFDLLKIITMVMIIILHFNSYGNILSNVDKFSSGYYIFNLLEYLSIVAVNIYIFITGYFMINKNIKVNKIFSLIFMVLFYSYIFNTIGLIINHNFSFNNILKLLIPVSMNSYWFMSCYIIFYLLIPFVNKFINSLNKYSHRLLLIILISLFCLLSLINSSVNIGRGYNIIWFFCLYLTGSYIKLYFDDSKLNNYLKNKRFILLISYLIISIIILLGLFIYNKFININKTQLLTNYNFILIYLNSLCLFLYFKYININNSKLCNVINKISSLSIGVYLFHESVFFRRIIWNFINPVIYLNSYKIYFVLLFSIIGIFSIGIIIEFLRKKISVILLKIGILNKINNKILSKVNKYVELGENVS